MLEKYRHLAIQPDMQHRHEFALNAIANPRRRPLGYLSRQQLRWLWNRHDRILPLVRSSSSLSNARRRRLQKQRTTMAPRLSVTHITAWHDPQYDAVVAHQLRETALKSSC